MRSRTGFSADPSVITRRSSGRRSDRDRAAAPWPRRPRNTAFAASLRPRRISSLSAISAARLPAAATSLKRMPRRAYPANMSGVCCGCSCRPRDAAAPDERVEWIGAKCGRFVDPDVDRRHPGAERRPDGVPERTSFAAGGDAHRLEHRADRHQRRAALEVVDAEIVGTGVDDEVGVRADLETPGLAVVAARCPARELENAPGARRHFPACARARKRRRAMTISALCSGCELPPGRQVRFSRFL
jgi:hypothetical protein